MSSSSAATAAAQYKLDANSNAIALIADAAVAAPASLTTTTTTATTTSPCPSPSTVNAAAAAVNTVAVSSDRIEWSRATILGFIEDYRRQRVLWDPNTKGYHIKQTKYEALKMLSQKYGTEIRSIRSKIKSLRSSFHREHGKVLNGRSRGVNYQPMWFAYEAIRFILDGERCDVEDVDTIAAGGDINESSSSSAVVAAGATTAEAAEKLQQQSQQPQVVVVEPHEEFAARVAAAVAVVQAAAAAAATARDRDRDRDHQMLDTSEMDPSAVATIEAITTAGGGGGGAAAAAAASSSAAVTRSSSELDGENYCNISADDVKTEIIEHETELGILDRRTSTPSPINYYKATDLTYNHRKRKAQMDENGCDGVGVGGGGIGIGIGVAGVGSVLEQHVVGALTLTPITKTATSQQMTNHRQLAFQALQQHFNHNHSGISISHCNGQMHLQHHHQHHNNHHHHHQHHQQQQQLQQQHSNNMALKRDRDRDLSSSSATAGATISSSSLSSGAATSSSSAAIATTSASATPIKPSHIDEYGIFGEYVAITIRKLKTTKSKIVVKHLINNLLYEAELGKYDHGIPASKEPPQLYKMQ
ncbi:uncharacterized protein Dwil_GK17163 [Drosophila willistoni]|uniref:MADF domain-containing protein n=1 Tax=Drosophila willistoni TaxID=7260 RepID=B4MKM4_DROWI|nr:uncharacterized protein Dwil_GK17163 [Drosophila willistoni]